MLEVDEGVGGPQLLGDLFARDQFAGVVQQHAQDLKWLGIKPDPYTLAAKLSGYGVSLKNSEAIAPCWLRTGHVVSSVSETARWADAEAMYRFR